MRAAEVNHIHATLRAHRPATVTSRHSSMSISTRVTVLAVRACDSAALKSSRARAIVWSAAANTATPKAKPKSLGLMYLLPDALLLNPSSIIGKLRASRPFARHAYLTLTRFRRKSPWAVFGRYKKAAPGFNTLWARRSFHCAKNLFTCNEHSRRLPRRGLYRQASIISS